MAKGDIRNLPVDQSTKLKSVGNVGVTSRKFKIAKPSSPTFAKGASSKKGMGMRKRG